MRLPSLALALSLGLAGTVQADVLEMPAGSAAGLGGKPVKGSTMQAVVREFGAPSKKYKPVGGGSKAQPPITRWDYPGFSVFFEYDHVVDAVVPGAPPALQRIEELK